jgi:hypothetical protein
MAYISRALYLLLIADGDDQITGPPRTYPSSFQVVIRRKPGRPDPAKTLMRKV